MQVSGGLEITWVLNAEGQVGSLRAWADSFHRAMSPAKSSCAEPTRPSDARTR